MTPRSPSEWRTSPLALKPLTAILCLFVGLMATLLTPRASPSSTRLLHYAPLLPRVCSPPTWVRARSRVRAGCILVEDVRFADVVLRVSPGVLEQGSSWIIELSLASAGAKMTPVKVWEIKGGGVVEGLVHNASGLLPDSDYGVQVGVRELGAARADVICRTKFVTRPDARNFVINPGFEKAGDPPYAATRFRSGDPSSPRQWTPFYNGGVRVVCGSVPISNSEVVTARSGECCAQFGHRRVEMWTDDIQKYFGAHQAIPIHGNTTTDMLVGAWYRVSSDLAPSALSDATSVTDALAMIVSWQLDDGSVHDGVIVPLDPGGPAAKQWTFSCIIVKPPTGRRFQMIHIYFHRHDYAEGSLFVDDVVARPFHIDEPKDDLHSECPSHHLLQVPPSSHKKTGVEFGVRSSPPERHLRSLVRPQNGQLTLAVPLTADRVLRLEAMSRLYGGGPIAAAVLVQDDSEALRFTRIWRRKPWLLYHVDVTLVYIPAEERTQGRIPINAIRNIAVHLATTEFVVMLDVDMTPSTDTFACFRDPNGTWLEGMLPRGSGRVGALPVFITDVQHRPASSRSELLNQLNTRVGSTYCLNSQKPNKVSRWYTASEPYEIRFMTDYEPYGICRRDEHPAYDERFVGYGFNKISWAYGAEAAGWHLFVLSDSFVTHLNHVENDWVQSISVPLYLQTWRRYLAFVAEVAANHVPLKRTLVPPRDW